MSQYAYTMDFGRRGAAVSIYRLGKAGSLLEYVWQITFNSRGIRCIRVDSGGDEVCVADFGSFLYPDRIEEEELDLATMLYSPEVPEDRLILRLCSLLVAKWAAGHDEESFHDTLRLTLKKWG